MFFLLNCIFSRENQVESDYLFIQNYIYVYFVRIQNTFSFIQSCVTNDEPDLIRYFSSDWVHHVF